VSAPSPYLAENLAPFRTHIRVLPNAIDCSRYPFRHRLRPAPRLVWLRAFHRIYNPCLAVQVAASLAPDFPDLELMMYGADKGDGSLNQVRALAVQAGVRDRVCLAGPVSKAEVPRCLDEGDIFLNTTDFDNTPVSVLEAMACGLCVVTTGAGGIPWLVENGREAVVVPVNHRAAMAEAVRHILAEPDLAARLSWNARAKVETFDWAAVLPQWMELLEDASRA
jgi:glycosyltransferase involved in cell wall biosynthesis